ncbi:MAG: LamG domain-containing protein [Kiritimatiellia bacterium]
MKKTLIASVLLLGLAVSCVNQSKIGSGRGFRAGAAAVNIDPLVLPVLRNGSFVQAQAAKVVQSLYARSLVLESGTERIAICVVDSCMLDRELCDQAKALASIKTGIRVDQILICATHTHGAPSAMRALGCGVDQEYTAFLWPKIAESIALAAQNVRPAKAAWAVTDAEHYTNCRRWIYLPHTMPTDPYGQVSVRAMMHPGHVNSATAGPAGPIDPDLTVLSIQDDAGRPLAMEEVKITFQRRMPDRKRQAWANSVTNEIKGLPKSQAEVLATEVLWIRDNPSEELKLQALRIGDLGITAIPNEVYGITGLKIKLQSPFTPTMNIGLANGSAGYIPPPEQHELGGYTTWPARTAGLEVGAEPGIMETLLTLLEQISGQPRRQPVEKQGAYVSGVMKARPSAYWAMDTISGRLVPDQTGNGNSAVLNPGYALFLPGPKSDAFSITERGNRSVHMAGGRMVATIPGLADHYSVSFWFWNAMPSDVRAVTGYCLSYGADGSSEGDHLGIGGIDFNQGKLVFFNGNTKKEILAGTSEIKFKQWHHVLLVRSGKKVNVCLDGASQPEISGEISMTRPAGSKLFVGRRSDNQFNFEGKIDEVAVFNRQLQPENEAVFSAHWRIND